MSKNESLITMIHKKSGCFNTDIDALRKKAKEIENAREGLAMRESALSQERVNLQLLEKDFRERSLALSEAMSDFYRKTVSAAVKELNVKLKDEVNRLQNVLDTSTIKEGDEVAIGDITSMTAPTYADVPPVGPAPKVRGDFDKEAKKTQKNKRGEKEMVPKDDLVLERNPTQQEEDAVFEQDPTRQEEDAVFEQNHRR